ncbi:MAG: rod shape-determining protein MreD [Pseudomonadota bacterium]
MTSRESEPVLGLFVFSIIVAFSLAIVPMPEWLGRFRPDWVALVIIYWLMVRPRQVGIGAAWLVGLILDALKSALLGQHALAMAVVGFLAIRFRLRTRVFPVWQQMLSVSLMIAMYQFILYWIDGVSGQEIPLTDRLATVAASALVWPFISLILSTLRR